MPLFNRTPVTEPLECPDFIDEAVWDDIGQDRRKGVVGQLEGAEGWTEGLPRLTSRAWFAAVEGKMSGDMRPMTLAYIPADQMQSMIMPATEAAAEAQMRDLQTEARSHESSLDEVKDMLLAQQVDAWLTLIANEKRNQATAEADRIALTCHCGQQKNGQPQQCGLCDEAEHWLRVRRHLASEAPDGRTVEDQLRERLEAKGWKSDPAIQGPWVIGRAAPNGFVA